jgi:hypothetical protein
MIHTPNDMNLRSLAQNDKGPLSPAINHSELRNTKQATATSSTDPIDHP